MALVTACFLSCCQRSVSIQPQVHVGGSIVHGSDMTSSSNPMKFTVSCINGVCGGRTLSDYCKPKSVSATSKFRLSVFPEFPLLVFRFSGWYHYPLHHPLCNIRGCICTFLKEKSELVDAWTNHNIAVEEIDEKSRIFILPTEVKGFVLQTRREQQDHWLI